MIDNMITGPFSLTSFRKGDRVEIGPHLDLWMMGARFGNVTRTVKADGTVRVKLDKWPKVIRVKPDDIFAVIEGVS